MNSMESLDKERAERAIEPGSRHRIPTPSLITTVVLCFAAAYFLAHLVSTLPGLVRRWDFSLYYTLATSLRRGGNPYINAVGPLGRELGLQVGSHAQHAADTPTFLLCLEPLTLISVEKAYVIWQALSALCFAAGLYLLLARSGFDRRKQWLFAALAIIYLPVAHNFVMAQSQFVVLLILALTMRAMDRGSEAGAGLLLALAGLLRAYPLALLGYFVVRRRWRVVEFAIFGLAIGGVITLALVGITRSFSFLAVIGFGHRGNEPALQVLAAQSFFENASLYAFIYHILSFIGPQPASINTATLIASVLADIVILAITALATASADSRDPHWRGYCLWIVAMLMISPVTYTHYLSLLIIVLIQVAIAADQGEISQRAWVAAAASYVAIDVWFVAITNLYGSGTVDMSSSLARVLVLVPFPALLMAYVSAFWFVRDREMPAQETESSPTARAESFHPV